MTDRQELTTEAIYDIAAGDLTRDVAAMCATAALKVLGKAGAMLPKVSPNVTSIHLFHDDDGWTCNVQDDSAGIDVWVQNRPTITAVIEAALEGAE